MKKLIIRLTTQAYIQNKVFYLKNILFSLIKAQKRLLYSLKFGQFLSWFFLLNKSSSISNSYSRELPPSYIEDG